MGPDPIAPLSAPKTPEQEVTLSLHPPIRVHTPIPPLEESQNIQIYKKQIFINS
jgi:hypothetical protein